jgi:hypothetical protein
MLVSVNPNAGNHMILFDTVNRGTKEPRRNSMSARLRQTRPPTASF